MTRTDPHRPSEICPVDYDYQFSFSLASTVEGWPVPAINMDKVVALRSQPHVVFSPVHSATNVCDVCGAWFTHGDVWLHRPTGEYITVGHICADKYEMYADRDAWRSIRGSAIAAAERRARKLQAIRGCRALLADEPGLRVAFRTRHGIIDDIKARFIQYGSLSPKQIALVLKIHKEELARAAEPDFGPTDAPTGRRTVEATVLGTRWDDNQFGGSLKMLVRIEVGDGTAWKAWGTAPAALNDALSQRHSELAEAVWTKIDAGELDASKAVHPERPQLKGCKVRFAATFERSDRDRDFAFFRRPAKATILEFA